MISQHNITSATKGYLASQGGTLGNHGPHWGTAMYAIAEYVHNASSPAVRWNNLGESQRRPIIDAVGDVLSQLEL